MSEQLELEIEEEKIKLPEISKIKIKMPNVKAKEDNVNLDHLMESVQQTFPFMNLH